MGDAADGTWRRGVARVGGCVGRSDGLLVLAGACDGACPDQLHEDVSNLEMSAQNIFSMILTQWTHFVSRWWFLLKYRCM